MARKICENKTTLNATRKIKSPVDAYLRIFEIYLRQPLTSRPPTMPIPECYFNKPKSSILQRHLALLYHLTKKASTSSPPRSKTSSYSPHLTPSPPHPNASTEPPQTHPSPPSAHPASARAPQSCIPQDNPAASPAPRGSPCAASAAAAPCGTPASCAPAQGRCAPPQCRGASPGASRSLAPC